jgi:preprotein translocase subunit SecB
MPDPAERQRRDTQPIAGILQQYVKDLSVENPKAPDSFQWNEQPQMDVQFNISARKINEEVSEIELKISVNSKASQGTVYIVELSYCGPRRHAQHAREHKHAFTYAEAPRILFPFARRVIGDAVRDAGLRPADARSDRLSTASTCSSSPAHGRAGR